MLHRYHGGVKRILEPGRSRFSSIKHDYLQTSIDSPGFASDTQTAARRNFHFDLNDAQDVVSLSATNS